MYIIYAEVDPGFSERELLFKGTVWGAAPEDIGIYILKTQKLYILHFVHVFNPLTCMFQLTGLKTDVH